MGRPIPADLVRRIEIRRYVPEVRSGETITRSSVRNRPKRGVRVAAAKRRCRRPVVESPPRSVDLSTESPRCNRWIIDSLRAWIGAVVDDLAVDCGRSLQGMQGDL